MTTRESRKNEEKSFQNKFLDVVRLLTTVLLGLTCLYWAGGTNYYLEKFTHFKVQYCAFFLLSILAFTYFQDRKWLLLSSIGLIFSAAEVLIWILPSPFQEKELGRRNIRVYLANVLTTNRNYARLLQQINATNPDIICLLETSQDWINNLEKIKTRYPFHLEIPRDDNFGISIYSKLEMLNTERKLFGKFSTPSIISDLKLPEGIFKLILTHPLPPIGQKYFQGRNQQMESLAEFITEQSHPVILAGDLNMTPWSPYFQNFVRQSKMRGASQGFGWTPTWPEFPLLKIPLDHILINQNTKTKSFQVLESIGSDHNPVFAQIGIAYLDLEKPTLRKLP